MVDVIATLYLIKNQDCYEDECPHYDNKKCMNTPKEYVTEEGLKDIEKFKPCPYCFPNNKVLKKSMKLKGNIECLKCKGQGFIKDD